MFFIYDKNSKIPDRIGVNFFLAKADLSSGFSKVMTRGKTKNHNVIFSLYLKKSFKNTSDDYYIKKLILHEIHKHI